jgi:hypothetical protein
VVVVLVVVVVVGATHGTSTGEHWSPWYDGRTHSQPG